MDDPEVDEIEEAPADGDRAAVETMLPPDAAEAYMAVDGMHCTTCGAFLGLRGDDRVGIQAVEANYGTETARVVYDSAEIEREELPEALSGYGYTLRFRDATSTDDGA
ncbi:heavy-metal-associated domain-containing protein, partial [Halorubrum ezzemoulense]|uniref:heavy-metal-associated domain-containing protein n=1 Tax=Halorubrum ezzemoulense TaxID=337243 RepID=UPI00233015B4